MTIHEEVTIEASPAAVYGVLTHGGQFTTMTGGRAAEITAEEGGTISLFGGDIRGRNIELQPGRRVVQAWRSEAWPEGVYSVVRFELQPEGKGTRLTFDQAGYPDDAHAMLESGWKQMYWDPMNRMLSGGANG